MKVRAMYVRNNAYDTIATIYPEDNLVRTLYEAYFETNMPVEDIEDDSSWTETYTIEEWDEILAESEILQDKIIEL